MGSEALAAEVGVLRSLLLRGREHPEPDPALHDQGRKLYDLLIAPAAATVAGSQRLLISADGPLQTLPFAALVLPGGSYLAEARPIHKALSATLFAEIRRSRTEGPATPAATGTLAVFGEPSYPVAAGAVRTLRSTAGAPPLLRYRQGLPPLPFAKLEAAGLATLYGADAQVFLGPAATEGRLRALAALGRGPRYLHFASHALLDRRFPLDSALALSPGGGDDGLLQAWEIFEKVRTDADLVTLAACETGLGEDAGGEGLIGLTRAFQYAGARSVLASLWEVSDRSTALLMRRFYEALRAGSSKDEALRQAQLALLHGRNGAALPYAWAAFELTGDWR
jgi:CHAT domain-containing protein